MLNIYPSVIGIFKINSISVIHDSDNENNEINSGIFIFPRKHYSNTNGNRATKFLNVRSNIEY